MDKFEKCKSCLHYVEHYIKKNSYYHPIGGHCVNKYVNSKQRRNMFDLKENCEFWESNEPKTINKRKELELLILNIAKQLKEIAKIIK